MTIPTAAIPDRFRRAALAVLIVACPLGLGEFASGQAGRPGDSSDRARQLREAREAFSRAKDEASKRELFLKLRAAAQSEQAKKLRGKAVEAIKNQTKSPTVDEIAERSVREAALGDALADPKAADVISRAEDAGAAVQAAPNDAGADRSPPGKNSAPAPGDVPLPPERRPRDSKEPDEPDGQVVITAQEAAYFDAAKRIAVFVGDVFVDDPRFDLSSDELYVYFKEPPPPGEEPSAAAQPDGSEAPPQAGGSEIDRAVAKGREVVIKKLSSEGELQIGKCREAEFDAATGNIEMRDRPQVQSGGVLIRATARDTVIQFDAAGRHKVIGPSTTELIKQDDETPAAAPTAPTGS